MHRNGSGASEVLEFYLKSLQVEDAGMLKTTLPTVPNVDAVLKDGWTALMYVCNYGSIEKTELLLSRDADPCFISSPNMETPFTCAAMSNKPDEDSDACIKALLRKVPPEKLKSIVNAGNRVHMTALMHAANKKKPLTLLTLLKAGADVDAVENNGRTALFYAVSSRLMASCRHLLEFGADPQIRAKDGSSPLSRAQALGVAQLINLLEKNSTNKADVPASPRVVARVDSGLNGNRYPSNSNLSSINSSSSFTERLEEGSSVSSAASLPVVNGNGKSVSTPTTKSTGKSQKPVVVRSTSQERTRPSVNEILKRKQTSSANTSATKVNGEHPVETSPSSPLQMASVAAVTINESKINGMVPSTSSEATVSTVDSGDSFKENQPINPVSSDGTSRQLANDAFDWSAVSTNKPRTEMSAVDSQINNANVPEISSPAMGNKVASTSAQSGGESNDKKPEENDLTGCLASSSVQNLEDWQSLLHSLNLSHLTEMFARNNITFQQMLCLNDEDLKQMGVESMGARKKILESIHIFHITPWQKDSLPSVHDRYLTCKDCVYVFSNVAKQLGCILSTANYGRKQICRLPQLLLNTENGPEENIDALAEFIDDAIYTSKNLTEELALLKEAVSEIQTKTEVLPKFVVAKYNKPTPDVSPVTSFSWKDAGLLVLGGVVGGTIVGAFVLSRDPTILKSLTSRLFAR